MKRTAAFIMAIVLGAGGAVAQNFKLPPTFGAESLSAGFTPDPFSIEIVAGGPIRARDTVDCAGYIAEAPDFRLSYAAGDLPLFISVISGDDTTLVVRAPGDDWICDDDSGGSLNPLVTISSPLSGQYDIWVGVFNGGAAEAELIISETGGAAAKAPGPPAETAPAVPPAPAVELDPDLEPLHGVVVLNEGFDGSGPNLRVLQACRDGCATALIDLTAGGDGLAEGLGDRCRGFVSSTPSVRLDFSAGSEPLYVYAWSDGGATLILRDPEGNWSCDDDLDGPVITIEEPASGDYLVWVGNQTGAPTPATLYFSSTTLDESLTVRTGELVEGFVAGAERVGYENTVEAGGLVPARGLRQDCGGFVNSAPGYVYPYTPGAFSLAIQAVSDVDVTLAVRDPDGNWHCDKDRAGNGSPRILVEAPTAGRYSIWIGTKQPIEPSQRLEGDDPMGIGELAQWFIGDPTNVEATLYFFEFTPGCEVVRNMPGAQRC